MSVPFRPMGLVKEMLTSMGLEATYMYDDLVFVSHNAFMLQFGEQGEDLGLHINIDCPEQEAVAVQDKAVAAAAEVGLVATFKGKYELIPNENETLSVRFL